MRNDVEGAAVGEVRSKVRALVAAIDGQEAFARHTGLSQSWVSRFLSGKAGLSARHARVLAISFPHLRPVLEAAIFEAERRADRTREAASA